MNQDFGLWLLFVIAVFALVQIWRERAADEREARRERARMDYGRNHD